MVCALTSSDKYSIVQMIIDSAALVVEPDETPTPFEASTGEKRKREGRIRSGVWQHFTRLEKKPGEREECRCNHCGQLYACSSRSGTGHLNRHIFDGRCPKYKPMPLNSQASIAHEREDLDDIFSGMPPKVSPMDTPSDSLNKVTGSTLLDVDELNVFLTGSHLISYSFDHSQEDLVQMESQLAPLKRENTKLRKEKDALTAQKESLEQLLVAMAAETVRFFLFTL